MMATTVSRLATQAVADIYETYPNLLDITVQPILTDAIQTTIESIISTEIPLARTEPDYERIMLQLFQALSEDKDWYDILVAGTGTALLRMIASGITMNEFSIQRALQEAFLGFASSDNSVYAATRMLGVRPRRKLPSRVSVKLTRDVYGDYKEIPKFSSFTIGALAFFNRDTIVFKSTDTEVTVTLYQGLVVTETITSNGEPFQSFIIGNGTRSASDTDVIVSIDGIEWERNTDGPWENARNSKVYYESTTLKGDIEIKFGNGEFGAIPTINRNIVIQWVETLGLAGNLDSANTTVVLISPQDNTITGATQTTAQGGDDEISAKVYRQIASNLRAANRRAVRRSDYTALALEFAGIKDALFRGQAEVAPTRRSMMNVIVVTLLLDNALTTSQWNAFVKEFSENLGVYSFQFLRSDPVPITVNIDATVYCRPSASLEDIKSQLTKMIEDFFKPKKGHLGFNVYLSDISDLLNGRNSDNPNEKLERDIEYCTINNPLTDVILEKRTHYCRLGTLNLDLQYTSRGGYSGRLDLSTTTATT